ncbi:MAG: hypothetical protein OEO77_09915 [Acidimicrobiia bacterium]|nr:hypothetical protein [Acidimicrobiia bacterium]
MSRFSVLAFLVVLAACGGPTGTASERLIDCERGPLAVPVFEIEGVDVPESGHVALAGPVEAITDGQGRIEIRLIDGTSGQATVRMEFPQSVQTDLQAGSVVEIDYWQRQGFEGTARGIRISDEAGIVLVADDGDYGNAVRVEDLAPFAVTLIDIGCRNRRNEPGDLNGFALAVSAGDDSVRLTHGQTGGLMVSSRQYTALAIRSVAAVDDAFWTDAPLEYTSFVIWRTTAG